MNKVTLMGNLTRDPDVRYSQGEKSTCVARYTLGIRRRFHRDGDPDSDFINCVAFGKQGEFAEKYLKKGMKIAICGRIQTGSYTDKDGIKRYTTDIVVEEHYFVESKNANIDSDLLNALKRFLNYDDAQIIAAKARTNEVSQIKKYKINLQQQQSNNSKTPKFKLPIKIK